MKRLFTGFMAIAMVLAFAGSVSTPASADNAAILQQIANLQAQLTPTTTTTTTTGSYNFTRDLTLNDTGPDVVALQSWLIAHGYSIPAGATGFFGSQTQAAVSAWQTASNITPTAGYFGPKSRAVVASMTSSSTTTTSSSTTSATPGCASGASFSATSGSPCVYATSVAGCAAGAMFSATTGASCTTTTTTTTTSVTPGCAPGATFSATSGATCVYTTTTSTGGASTAGKEGIMTVSLGATPVPSNIFAGDHQDGILGIQIQAQQSDIDIQRVTLDLGSDTRIFNKIYSEFYVKDPNGNVLASMPLNINTVTKSGSTYFVSLTGFHYVVTAGTTQTISIAADLYPSIDSTLTNGSVTFTTQIDQNGVRGVDQAGIDIYGPAIAFSRGALPSASLSDNATVQVSADSATPLSNAIIATGGASNNQYDQLPMLNLDLFAQKDNIQLTDLVMTFKKIGTGAATTTTAYLYDGSTLVGSASINPLTGIAQINNMSVWTNNNTTKVLTVKADIRSANALPAVLSVTVTGGAYIAGVQGLATLNSQGNTIFSTGSAASNNFTIRSVGPVISLVGAPTLTKSATAAQNNNSTSTATAAFNFNIQALGGDLYFGTQAASSTFNFVVYAGGAPTVLNVASTTSWTIPSTGVVLTGLPSTSTAFKLQQNNSLTNFPVTFYFEGRTVNSSPVTGNTYAVQFTGLNWSTTGNDTQTTNFMANLTNWQTNSVQLP